MVERVARGVSDVHELLTYPGIDRRDDRRLSPKWKLVAPYGNRAGVRHAETAQWPVLVIRAVVSGRREARLARLLCHPRRRTQLVERSCLPAAHVITGEIEDVAANVFLGNGRQAGIG